MLLLFLGVLCRTSHRPFRVSQPCARLVGHVVLLKEPDLFAHRCFPFLRRIELRGSTLVWVYCFVPFSYSLWLYVGRFS